MGALAGTTAASAGTKTATPACQVTDPTCTEPVVAQAFNPVNDFSQPFDFAMTYGGPLTGIGVPGGPVNIGLNNNIQDGSQDWDFNQVGVVPAPGIDPPFPFGLSAFDLQNYAGDPIFEIAYTPFGQFSGLCLTFPSTSTSPNYNKGTLKPCNSTKNQVFIVTAHPPFVNPSPPGYVFALLLRHNVSAQRHPVLTAPTAPFDLPGRLTVSNAEHKAPGVATDQMWSALP
jgi:hypothetical protein